MGGAGSRADAQRAGLQRGASNYAIDPTRVDHLTLRAQAHVQYTMHMQIAIDDVTLA